MIPPFRTPQSSSFHVPFMDSLTLELELVCIDMPVCVLLHDSMKRRYLSHLCGSTKDGREFWYIVPIGDFMLPRLLSGQVSLRTALIDVPQEQRLIAHVMHRDEEYYELGDFYECDSIDMLEQCLPNSTFRFFDNEFEHYLAEDFAPIASYARQCLAEVFYLRLTRQRMLPNLFPLAQLADIGKALQRLLTNLAMFDSDAENFGRRGVVLQSVERASQFALTAIAAGSVKLRLESLRSPELLEEYDIVHRSAARMSELTETAGVSVLCDRLSAYPPRIKTSYLAYLTALTKTEANVNLQWGSPRRADSWESEWSADLVAEIVQEVSQLVVSEETVYELTGYFTAGSIQTGRFDFYDPSCNRKISGRISPDVTREIVALSRDARSAALYDVTVREVLSTAPDNSTKCEYTFIDVQDARSQH